MTMPRSLVKHKSKVISTETSSSASEAIVSLDPTMMSQEASVMLGFLSEVGRKVGSVSKLDELVKHITGMTKHTLNASASSVLLFDDGEEELHFEVTDDESEKVLKHIRLSAQSGIAGWVARHGKPMIVRDTSQNPRFNRSVDKVTGFTTKSIICVPLIVHRNVIGVIEVLNKLDGSDFTEQDLETLTSVASTAAMAIENTKLQQSVLDAYKSTIRALAAAIDAKDHYTRGHSQRVMEYALLGGASLSLSQDELEILEYAGLLHDVGKIGVADGILGKPASLTAWEWEVMHQHPQIGFDMLKDVPFLEKTRAIILYHHERYDGGGYPSGLRYEDIPIGARLLAVADAFDTMTTDRAYRAALGVDYAVRELYGCSGAQFCPLSVDAFVSGYSKHAKNQPVLNPNG